MAGKSSPVNEEEIKKLNLPAGYIFRPTGVELVAGHLIPKLVLVGFKRPNACIMDLNVYDYNPDQLPFNKFKYVVENEAYFFTEDLRANEAEEKRATPNGYWKVYKGDAPVKRRDDVIGSKTKLRFHGADGLPTPFKMAEYRCMPAITQLHTTTKKYMICKVKNGGVCSSGAGSSSSGRKRSKQSK